MEQSLFSIGYGHRTPACFLSLLKSFEIEYLIDVRSRPYSKFNKEFSHQPLSDFLHQNQVKYVFMGNALGGKPRDSSCYTAEGKVDYEILKTRDFYLQGIERLKTAHQSGLKAAIMCSESNPRICHRTRLIGKTLAREGIFLMHIDEKGNLKDHASIISEINKGLSEVDLFGL